MQVPVLVLSSVLLVGAVAFAFADYRHLAPETSEGARLGKFYLQDDSQSVEDIRSRLEKVGYGTAAPVFRAALGRDAGSADRWSDVGEALLSTGDRSLAGYCYRRAGELAPSDLQILLNAGDFYSNTGDSRRAVAAFSNILRQSNDAAEKALRYNTFTYYERMHVRQNGMLGDAIPDAASAQGYVRYLMEEADPAAVRDVWLWSHEKGFDDDRQTVECVTYLFRKQNFAAAFEGWNRHFEGREDPDRKSSAVFNGGFEYELVGSDLDWHFNGLDGVRVARDGVIFHDGRHSLRIDFTGNDNPDFRHVSQVVLLRPGRYRFQAYLRTDGITSDQGVRFGIRDVRSNRVLAETAALTGTNDWRNVEADVDVPAGVSMAAVEFARHRSIRIDNQLSGTAWVDNVKLTRVN